MIGWVLVWLLAATLEGVVYTASSVLHTGLRRVLLVVALLLGVVSTVVLVTLDWKIWLAAGVLGTYRLLNGCRFLKGRLPAAQLRTTGLRAHGWLVCLQLALVAISSGAGALPASKALGMLAALQLLAALVLLRSSLHTWQHTEPFSSAPSLTDKELPSLSVLVPARNETEALERCLSQLVASDYPKLEIIVLDDDSTNRRTPDIIRSFAREGVRFVQGAAPNETTWLAKNQAYARLRQEASGELLLFCGVDALFTPDSLRKLVGVLMGRGKDMLSVLPPKDASVSTRASVLQPMRYYWEICLPRRFFKRPPVLSTCWLIRAALLDKAGGFEAVSRSITPEAYFARQAVVHDGYSFIRSNAALGIYSAKPVAEQYETSVRMRYPQLHRRLELVAFTSLLELCLLLGPIIGLCCVAWVPRAMAFATLWAVCVGCLLVTYYLVAVATKLSSAWVAWLLMPPAFICDIIIQHISLYKYEFSHIEWKGRDVTTPVMHFTSVSAKQVVD